MSSRVLEVLMLGVLIMVTLSVGFQFQNQQVLHRIFEEMREQRLAGGDASPQRDARRTASADTPGQRRGNSEEAAADRDADPSEDDADAEDSQPTRLPLDPQGEGATDPSAPQPTGGNATAPPGDADADSAVAEAGSPSPAPADDDGNGEGEGEMAGLGLAAGEIGPDPTPAEPAPDLAADSNSRDDAPDGVEAALEPAEAAPSPAEEDRAWQRHEEVVVACIRQLLDGDYTSVVRQFTPEMARRLPRGTLADILDPVRERKGGLEQVVRHENVTSGLDEGMHAFRVLVETTEGEQVNFTVTVTDDEEIAGLLMR